MQANLPDVIFEGARFLIIDDEISNVRVLEHMLSDWGCKQVLSTLDPRLAAGFYQEFTPDIILLDWMMPHLNGLQVMQQLAPLIADDDFLPILILTADTSDHIKRLALEQGAADFLTKPFDAVELSLRVQNLLARRVLQRQLQEQNQSLEWKVEQRTLDLAQSREQLQALAANLTSLIEAEKTRIAREVHDVLGQALTSLKMDVAWLEQRLPETDSNFETGSERSTPLREKTRAMSQHIDATIQSVQRIASDLRPALLDDFGLEAAIEWQMQEFQERTGAKCDFVSSLGEMNLYDEQSIAAFRIFQEALTNIARHAAANRVQVLLEENAGHLMLEVQDNGRGMDDIDLSSVQSLGLLGMQERARLVGGEVKIKGVAGAGTTVTICIPLRPEQLHLEQPHPEPA